MRLSGLVLAIFSLLLGTWSAPAAETICLKSGFCLEADSHSSTGDTLVLQLGSGTLEYAAQDVASIEPLPSEPSTPAPAEVPAFSALSPEQLLARAAGQVGLGSHADFVLSVAKVESGLRESAISKKGAFGLMQLMPGTAALLRLDPHDASQNALGGAKYLSSLLVRYHGDTALALAAYNAGPGAVDRFHGIPPFEETRSYVVRVLREYRRERQLEAAAHTAVQADSAHSALPAVQ